MQKACGHPQGAPTVWGRMISGSLSLPSEGFFSPFPHGTRALSVGNGIQPCGMGPTDSDGVSRVPPYLGSGTGARRFAHGAVTRRGPTFQTVAPAPRSRSCRPATPADRSAGLGFVRVRSPLLAESLLISSPRGTEMFHFPRCRLRALFDSHADGALARAGLLHSETHGSGAACASPWTIAACRVLLRPPSPRHPSCARKAWPPENVRRPLPCVAFHLARLDRLQ